MKFHQEDPRLSAYLLGELSPEESEALEYAVAADPALRLALEEAERTQSELAELLGGETDKLLPRHRNEIMRAAKEAARKGQVSQLKSHRKARPNWFWPVAAAAVVALGIFAMTLIPAPNGGKGVKQVSTNDSSEGYPEISEEGNITRLPLDAVGKSLALVTRSVREDGKMPSKEDVRIQELLNAFPLQAKDSVALWKGCSLGVEILACPWKPSGSLVFAKLRTPDDGGHEISMQYRKNDGTVITHRVLGYQNSDAKSEVEMTRKMEPGAELFLAILVEAMGDELGSLAWTVDGEVAPEISLTRDLEKEPSDDARFAALVCIYGLWLRGEEPAVIDYEVMLGLAREVAADGLVPDRYDFLNLVDQTVKLAEE